MTEKIAREPSALQRACEIVGGATALRNGLVALTKDSPHPVTITKAAVTNWHMRGEVPPLYCPLIEELTKGAVRCEDLNPGVPWSIVRKRKSPALEAT